MESNVIDLPTIRAQRYLELGNFYIGQGQIEDALESFKNSAQSKPTSEAYTFWAWMVSFHEKYEEAIGLCEKAIELDPDFGNPYNDIGSYLIRLGRYDEAIPWLEKALAASRYEPRHFPHINLGRIYVAQERLDLAFQEFHKALELSPDNPEILRVIEEIQKEIL